MRFKISLSYDGTPFYGWQIQPKDLSVQACLQTSLTILLGEGITVTGAGRTDTGVHAIGYYAHFDYDSNIEAETLRYKLNAILPPSICVHEICPADAEFHARFDAKSRSYMYFLHKTKDPFMEKRSYRCSYPLNVEAMNKAASYLLGTHDFSCFEKAGGNNKTSICTITDIKWESYTPDHVKLMGYPAKEGDYLVFKISADRFLRNMVRAITGTLIEIGRGKHAPEWIKDVMESHDRCTAGESVPGHALFLVDVKY